MMYYYCAECGATAAAKSMTGDDGDSGMISDLQIGFRVKALITWIMQGFADVAVDSTPAGLRNKAVEAQ